MNNPTRYLIAGFARSGTTLAHLLLLGHPHVSGFNDELRLHPLFSQGLLTYSVGGHLSKAEREEGLRRLFDAITGADATPLTAALGAKIAYKNARKLRSVVEAAQQMPDLKIILLNRSDLVAHFGSLAKLKETSISHSWNPKWRTASATRIRVNKYLFSQHVIVVLDALDEARRLRESHDFLEVSYEELSDDIDGQYRRILSFLGLPYVAPEWLASKKVLPSPADYIVNYGEMNQLQRRIQERYAAGSVSARWRFALKVYRRVHGAVFG